MKIEADTSSWRMTVATNEPHEAALRVCMIAHSLLGFVVNYYREEQPIGKEDDVIGGQPTGHKWKIVGPPTGMDARRFLVIVREQGQYTGTRAERKRYHPYKMVLCD